MNDTMREQPAEDDDRTRMVSAPAMLGSDVCEDMGQNPNVLPVGSRVAEFEITALVGQGGFGTVYEARDHALERVVAIKEYRPVSLSLRRSDGTVQPVSQRQRETFDLGMRSFINEARLLAQFDHPSLLKVYRFWQERGTAYMAMPFYRGPTLRQALAAIPGGASEELLLNIVDDLTQALAVMHDANCYHRDIAPDNILLLEDSNRPVLLDFGAARRVISDKTQTITTILKPGYAPIEQYAEMLDMPQGAWTDIYALAAVMHVAVTGHTPPPSVARLLADTYVPLAANAQLQGRFGTRLLAAIDAGLAVRPQARPQSIAAFRQLLGFNEETNAAPPAPPAPDRSISKQHPKKPAAIAQATEKTENIAPRRRDMYRMAIVALRKLIHARRIIWRRRSMYRITIVAASALLVLAAGLGWWMLRSVDTASDSEATAQTDASVPRSLAAEENEPQVPASQAAGAQQASPAVVEQETPQSPASQAFDAQPSAPAIAEQQPRNAANQQRSEAQQALPAAVEQETPQSPANQASDAQPSTLATMEQQPQDLANQPSGMQPPSQATVAQPLQNPASQASDAQPSTPATVEQQPQDSVSQAPEAQPPAPAPGVEFLTALSQDATHGFDVSATPRQQAVRVGRDRLEFKIRSSRAGYVYVYLLSSNGKLSLLFPNLLDKYNRVRAKQTLVLPNASWPLVAGGPPGTNHFAVLVSKYERDFTDSGARGGAIFLQFPLPDLAARSHNLHPLLGKPVCAAACQDTYGVTMFEITEK